MRGLDQDAVDTALFSRCQLRGADVHQHRIPAHSRRLWNQAAHYVLPGLIVDQKRDFASDGLSQSTRCPYRIRIVDVPKALAEVCIFACPVAGAACFGNYVDADERHGVAGCNDGCVILNSRTEMERVRERCQPAGDCFRNSTCSGDLKIVLPRKRFNGRMERARRSITGQIDCDYRGIAERHREKDEQSATGLAKQRPHHQPIEKREAAHFRHASQRCVHRECARWCQPRQPPPRCVWPSEWLRRALNICGAAAR